MKTTLSDQFVVQNGALAVCWTGRSLAGEVRLLVFQTGGPVNIYSLGLCKQYLRVLPTTCGPMATELLEVPGWLIVVVVPLSLT